jgi:hypothetical protein
MPTITRRNTVRLARLIPLAMLAAAPFPSAVPQAPVPPTVDTGHPAPGPSFELATILRRAGQYVLDYEEKFQDVAADEKYTQWNRRADRLPTVTTVVGAVPAEPLAVHCSEDQSQVALPYSCVRTTKADVVFVRLAGAVPWSSFRDVYEVDGKRVREREPRLERLFSSMPSGSAEPQARGLAEDSDKRYNIGPALRDIDAPTLSLMFLHPTNQARFAWTIGGRRRFGSIDTVEIKFQEVTRPTIVGQARDEDLPASGQLWIDPVQGTLVRSETEFRFEPRRARAFVATEYRLDPELGSWAPWEVREEYDDLKGAEPPLFGAQTRATAQFSSFRPISRANADQRLSRPVLPAYGAKLTELLQRAGEYVVEYERSFSDLVAEETYAQRLEIPGPRGETSVQGLGAPQGFADSSLNDSSLVGQSRVDAENTACRGCRRTTRADLVFVRLAGEIPWASYRDVFEVNGRKVREHEQRLVTLLANPGPDAQEQARKVLAASAAYNIGPVRRTVNLPTLPLLFLLPRNQERFEFRLGGRRSIRATEAVELVFRETARPTLVQGPWNADLPAQGRFWVNPTRGAVVSSEVEFAYGAEAQARVSTDYRPEPTLAMWVPAEMREHFADVPGAAVKTFPAPFNGVARYERFRRFTVSTDEQVAVPKP